MKDETMKETRVTYTLEKDGKFCMLPEERKILPCQRRIGIDACEFAHCFHWPARKHFANEPIPRIVAHHPCYPCQQGHRQYLPGINFIVVIHEFLKDRIRCILSDALTFQKWEVADGEISGAPTQL